MMDFAVGQIYIDNDGNEIEITNLPSNEPYSSSWEFGCFFVRYKNGSSSFDCTTDFQKMADKYNWQLNMVIRKAEDVLKEWI